MVHGWMRRFSKRFVSRRRKKGEAPPSLLYMGSGLHADTGCRKVYAGLQKNPMEAKEMIGDSGGRKYVNSQFSDKIGKM